MLTDNVRTAIMKNITRRMTPQPLKIRADIDMTCFAYDGVLHIQVITLFWLHRRILFQSLSCLLRSQPWLHARCIWQCKRYMVKHMLVSNSHTVDAVHRYHVKCSNVHSLSALYVIKSFGSLGYAGSLQQSAELSMLLQHLHLVKPTVIALCSQCYLADAGCNACSW